MADTGINQLAATADALVRTRGSQVQILPLRPTLSRFPGPSPDRYPDRNDLARSALVLEPPAADFSRLSLPGSAVTHQAFGRSLSDLDELSKNRLTVGA
jgi:hypothetical protein